MERIIETFSSEGISIEYSIIGEAVPIFVMHGGHSNCNEEFGYKALVENGYSVITPSRAGYGGTSKEVGKNLSIACEYYLMLLDDLDIGKVHLLAISAGGPSGIYLLQNIQSVLVLLHCNPQLQKNGLFQRIKNTRRQGYYFVQKSKILPGV